VLTGKVIRYDELRGYGFIAPDSGGEDVFLHVNDLTFDKRLLAAGVHVRFRTEEGDRGLKACDVALLEDSHPAPTAAVGRRAAEGGQSHYDVLSAQDLRAEITEILLLGAPSLTAQQIVEIRQGMLSLALSHGWIGE